MDSRLRSLPKFPRRTKETKESNPSNNEKQRLKWSAGTKVVGMYDFEEEDIEELSFRKGEVLVIEGVTEGINWYRAVNRHGRVGTIPRNYVRELNPVEPKSNAFVKNHRDQSERLKWSPGTEVVGMYDFEEEDIEKLSFRKGEVLVIEGVTEGINWYRAVNCDGRVGTIPYNFVRELKPVELKPISWFHGNLSRIKAERLFNPREEGMFLIRNSKHYQGDYALSVCYANNIQHYRIRKTDDGKLTIDEEVFFGSLSEIVKNYSRSANGLSTRLAKPVYSSILRSSFDEGGWEIDRSCLYSRDCIRRGDFGDIFQAVYLNKKVAVKTYSAERYQDVQAFLIEAAIMTNLQHRNIVTLLGVSLAKNPLYLVTEFCAKGNLLEFLSRTGSGTLQEDDLVRLAKDVADGMKYLQSKDVVHRGLMARNILIHEDGTAKVSEFGLAQVPSLSSERKNTSDKWTAPEAIRRGIFSSQSDVWSYGVLLWVLFSFGESPYSDLPADHLVDEIERGYRMECPKGYNTVIHDMMSNCWDIDPKKRPNFKEICKLLADFHCDEVPQEIRARGLLALRAYKKALSEGRTCIKRVPIMLIGQDRSGKTSLAKSLKGERFNPEEDSTVGIDADPSHFKVSTEIWKPGEKDEQQNVENACSYEHHVARLTVQNLSEEESAPKEESLESNQIEHLVQEESVEISVSEDFVSTSCARDENLVNSRSQSEEDIYAVPAASVVSNTTSHDSISNSESDDLPVDSVSISMSQDHTISDESPAGDIQTVPDNVASLVEVILRDDKDLESEEDIYSVLWDFGGQTVYYTTHPLFLTPRAIYLLVNDLSRHLHDKAKSVMKQGMFTKSQDSFLLKTNADYLDFWMSSVASLAIQDESHSKKTKSDLLPELPPVFLVCTHADKPCDGGDPRELGRMVFGHLQTKPYKTHLHDVFIVDNTKSGRELECPEVLRLRQEICTVAKELPHMKEAVPIKWLKFEKEMQAKKDEGNKWISLEETKEVAREVCDVSDKEEFRTLLNFLHDQRVLIHFDDTLELSKMVVLDTQWLINVFKEVITIRPFDSKEKKFKGLWSRLEKEGVLEEPLLEHVWGPLYRKEDTCQSLIALMEKFSLLCSWPSSDGSCGKQYLVPSMLMSHPPEEIMELIASAEIPSLFLKFETGQVPPGLFPRLVLQVLQWCKQECASPEQPQLYQNFVRIYRSEEVNCSVILLCHMSSIEVVVHRGNGGDEVAQPSKSAVSSPVNSNHDPFACALLRQLELMLEFMRREFCWLQNMKYEVSILCPVCCQGGVVSNCRTHLSKGCKQEECLHFWPESELCSGKKIIACTRSAFAKTNRLLAKDFEPWFSPMRNQLTIDKCDGGNLASVEATTEICLPDNVKQSLLSASCDAKEIVHQLKENLQLNKDFLERPDHDTKKIIRSLAQKAKDLKRIDVFEHLREIAPAGTTGPLLPENLPVQDMPIIKARDLTISLGGGDEWMKLAEELGLAPQEIRFLDKRTLNPMEAALSFITRRRFVSVGELYELLNEDNRPMLADLL